VTESKLDEYYNKFRGSSEEAEELLQLYEQHDGDMDTVFEYLPCSEVALDSHRFMGALEEAIKEQKVPKTKHYTSWCVAIFLAVSPTQRSRKPADSRQPVSLLCEATLLTAMSAVRLAAHTDGAESRRVPYDIVIDKILSMAHHCRAGTRAELTLC
jgi:hypothetical protein